MLTFNHKLNHCHMYHMKSPVQIIFYFSFELSLDIQDIMLTDLFIIPREKMIANMYIPKVKEKDRNLSAR